ncbi:MAG: hypothetical protein MUE50_05470 [Pirellulaceae bacterium]|jgi:hypothetical protein|nr:hypothetical protein [Pirellulaceae bacterium]
MNELQHTKVVACIPPGVIKDDASFVAVEIDTLGFDFLQVIIALGATDIAMAALKLQESETAGGGGGYTDIDGCDLATDNDAYGSAAALPSADDDNKLIIMEVDLRAGRMRYVNLLATAGNGSAGTYLSAIGILSRSTKGVYSAADRGADTVMRAA